jgi:hypothetical protein
MNKQKGTEMEFSFSLSLPDELARELMAAASERHCSPRIFAEETILSALASRRLPRIPSTAYCGRPGGIGHGEEDREPEPYSVRLGGNKCW